MSKHVLVVEPHASGHHGPYLTWMVEGLADHGWHVSVTTFAESITHPSLGDLLQKTRERNDARIRVRSCMGTYRKMTDAVHSTGTVAIRELRYWLLFRRWFCHESRTNGRPDVVFLPYVDYCLNAIGLLGSPFGSCPWVGLVMRPSFHYAKTGIAAPRPGFASTKESLFGRLLRNRTLRALITVDEPLQLYVQTYCVRYLDKIQLLREPTDLTSLPPRLPSKRTLGLPEDRKTILVYGAITKRKGISELVCAMGDRHFPDSVDILLAGEVSSSVYDVLKNYEAGPLVAQGRIVVLDRFIDSDEEPLVFSTADIVWLGYRGHYGPSGVLTQAASARRPVIACEQGLIGWQTRRYRLGEAVDPYDQSAVAHAVRRIIDGTHSTKTSGAGHAEQLVCSMSEAKSTVERALGIPE